MPSAPSRFEVDHLYRLMLEASAEAARLEDQVDLARRDDSLWPALRHWCEAAEALDAAVERARPELLRDGTPNGQIERVRGRLRDIEQRSRKFDLDFDLDPCVEAWSSLALDLGQLSGRQRDPLVRLLERRKPAIEQARAMLSEAQRQQGLLEQAHRKLLQAQEARDRAREKAERVKKAWLTAQRDREAADRQKAPVAQAQQHEVKKPPLPDLRRLVQDRPGAIGVRLSSTLQIDKTLSHLATAPHRTLTDDRAGELRSRLVEVDSILSRLRGAKRKDVLDGAQAIGSLFLRMHGLGARPGGPPHLAAFRELIEERRAQLHRIAQAQLSTDLARPAPTGLGALSQRAQIPGGLAALGNAGLTSLGNARAVPEAVDHALAGLRGPPSGTPLRQIAAKAERERSERVARVRRGPAPSQVTARMLLGALREHPKAPAVAPHLAPGGALRTLCETAQRGLGLPIGQAAQHYLASRGSSHVWNAVSTFNSLVKQGHTPRFSLGSWLKKNVSDRASHALHAVSQTVSRATGTMADVAGTARQGISSFTNRAVDMGRREVASIGSGVVSAGRGVAFVGHGALHEAELIGHAALGGVRHAGHALAHVASGGMHAVRGAASWAQGRAHWASEKVHSGLEWTRKTGVVGAVGTGLRKGLSTLKQVAEHTPLGYAVQKGYGFVKAGGLGKIWSSTKRAAGAAWGGLKTAYQTTSKFLQSPAGQLLVTGLSLAASFIPGGIVVKAAIGAGIGAMQAISEGKDWKAVLASAAGGAITGAIPFLKIGPLAKVGVGALQGGITALASGGSLKDALKDAAGGAIDAFDPGAFHALKRLSKLRAAEKLLLVKSPRARKTLAALEKAGSKGIKGGIWVSGKAARAQHVLDKVVRAGDKVHGVLSEVHDLAPGLADVLGDNAAGHFVSQVGDWAGQGDDRLQKALGYGHAASDTLSQYRGYLDKGLGYAGVKNPAKAYEKMMARRDLRAGRKGALEHVAQLKLEDHRRKHPELHLAEATRPRRQPRPARTPLERVLRRGREAVHNVQRVAQGVHDGLGKVHDVVGKGLAGAEKVQSGLEKAIAAARQGAQVLGDGNELGRSLKEMADRAERVHDYLGIGIETAQDFNRKVGATHDAIEKIPGIHAHAEAPTYLEGSRRQRKKSPHDLAPGKQKAPLAPEETSEERSARLSRAWERIGSVSRQVQKFETEQAGTQRKIQELLRKGLANAAAIELMGLGSRCEQISAAIREAKTLAKGNEQYEKEIAFYEHWHRATAAKLHAAIAETKGLGGEVAISGFGIQESTHPDIFANTRAIYAVRTKVESFGGALRDPGAREQVKKVLAEAKQAKSELQALKAKYRKDKAAHEFLTGGGMQDKLIDEALRKLEGAEAKPPAHAAPPKGRVHHALQSLERYRKKALKTGKRIDSGLNKVEHGLDKAIGVGKTIDSGLERIARVAEQVGRIVGNDSGLGHLADQVGQGAERGHEKLHDALRSAQAGKKFLHKGHEIFHHALQAAQGHHAKEIEKVHGKKPAEAAHHHESALERALHEGEHVGHDAKTLWKDGNRAVHDAGSLRDHLQAHDWKGAFGDAKALFGDAKKLWTTGKRAYGEGRRLVHDVRELVHGGWEFVKRLSGHAGHAPPALDPAQAVHNALQWVTTFGKQVSAAIQQIERLMHAGRTKEASDRVRALRALSDQTGDEVDHAVQAAAADPALAKEAASARKHYREIRAHLAQFIKGLHGLGADAEASPHRERTQGHLPARHRGSRGDPVADLIDGILDGADARIHVDRGAARGDVAGVDLQDVDPAAIETWLGSGEGVKPFSEVFGAFLPAERGAVVHHRGHRRSRGGHRRPRGHPPEPPHSGRGIAERLEGFADRLAGWARRGAGTLGKGMHYAETGMHRLSQVEDAAGKVDEYADEAESFLEKMGLHTLAGYAGRIGSAAERVDDEAMAAHGGLKKADHWMGEGKSALGKFGALVSLFKASKSGDGTEGRLSPEKVALGSTLDEPRRLDLTTLSKMESYLGGDFSGVRIHTGPGAAEVTRRFGAEAVTVQDHIFFAQGRFNPATVEGQKLIAHELTHVLQKGRANLDVRTAEGEALRSEHGYGTAPQMETLNLRRPEPGFRIASDGEGAGAASGIHTAKRTRSRRHESGGRDALADGDELLEQISGRVYEMLMEELEQAFESR